jgi:O-acetylhomoserine/O-acetylserine sulfhydrylase-like pyridoxal-dependent enzyme
VACADLKALGAKAREEGTFLLVDTTLTGLWGCEALRLGAHACACGLSEDLCVVGISRDAEQALPGVGERLDAMARKAPVDSQSVTSLAERADERWHRASDAAQVVASYLRCHPRVERVSYPGLKSDPSFAVAARTLQGGFGPLVDVCVAGDGKDGAWRRVTCGESDPKAQVMMLEKSLLTDGDCGVPLVGDR